MSFCFSASSSSNRSHGTLLIDLESFAPASSSPPLPLAAAAAAAADSLPSTARMCSRRWRCLVLILASSPHSIGTGVPPVPTVGGGPGGVDAAAPYLVSHIFKKLRCVWFGLVGGAAESRTPNGGKDNQIRRLLMVGVVLDNTRKNEDGEWRGQRIGKASDAGPQARAGEGGVLIFLHCLDH